MDNLTHSLTGLLLARAGLRRAAPRGTLLLLLAANAPDIDVLAWWRGPLAYLRFHRSLTHAAAMAPVMAGLAVAVAWFLAGPARREFRWGSAWLAALAGVGSHILMDFTNTYGIRPWLPFSGKWYSWDISFIVDLWVWAVLLLAAGLPVLGRLINAEIGARPETGKAAAVAGLLFIVAWWGVRDLLHRQAAAMLSQHLYGFDPAASSEPGGRGQGPSPPLRVAAFPSAANPFAWHGLIETESFYQVINVDVRRPLDPSGGEILYKPSLTAPLDAALQTRTAREFSAFARYRYAAVDRVEGGGYRVTLTDLRFRAERRDAFLCTIDLDENLKVTRESFSF